MAAGSAAAASAGGDDAAMAFYRAMEQFFGECLGGRVQPTVNAAISSHLQSLIVDPDSIKLGSKKP